MTGAGELIHELLDDATADSPQARAIRDATGEYDYSRLAALSHAFAAWLADRGVGRGDRVVTVLPSTRELAAMFYGTCRRGAIFVPLNPGMKEFHLGSVLGNAEPALVISTGQTVPRLANLSTAPAVDLADIWSEVESAASTDVEFHDPAVHADDVAVLVYTSGSTAAPKGVICPHAQVTFASRAINAELGYRPDDVVFCRFPLSWDYGLYKVLLSCLGRSEIVLAGTESDLQLLKRMRETGATVVPIVPSLATMIVRLAQRETREPPPVRMFTNTGAALPAAISQALRKAFPAAKVVRQFGQTECKRISIVPPEEEHQRAASVGRPLPGTTVLILDPDGNRLPAGEVGEIVVTGPHVMPGYWRAPELTARTFRRDEQTGRLRLHTGDYGSLDADGYLYFEGRRDDMFKRKGIRMSTIEIEAAAMDVPGVRAAAVLPPDTGRDLAIFVATELAPHVLLKELAQRLEPAKVPAHCHVVEEVPLTMHGKNAREALLALLPDAHGATNGSAG